MINEQELQEAVEVIFEGGSSLGVSCEEVYRVMLTDEPFVMKMMEKLHECDSFIDFDYEFRVTARNLLIQAYEQEQVDKYLCNQEYSQIGM